MVEPNSIDVEKSLARLEEIVSKLESEEVNLERSLKLFQEGINLADQIKERLNQSKLKIKEVIDKSGTFQQEDFEI